MLKFKLVASKAYTKAREAYTLAKAGQVPEIGDIETLDILMELLGDDGVRDAEFEMVFGNKCLTQEIIGRLRHRGIDVLPARIR